MFLFRSGLKFKTELNDINVLEVGFGTGLNALLTFIHSEETNRNIKYTSLEAYPLKWDLVSKLNYIDLIFNGKYFTNIKKCTLVIGNLFMFLVPILCLENRI